MLGRGVCGKEGRADLGDWRSCRYGRLLGLS